MNLILPSSLPCRWPAAVIALSFWLQAILAQATPIFEPVYRFEISPAHPRAGVIRGSDGNFYGTTPKGGSFSDPYGNGYGTVFRMTPGGVITNLVNFNLTNGSTPEAALVQGSDGNFYGTTSKGGSSDSGTVFKMTPGGELTTLVNCNFANGRRPVAALVQGNDGSFYGTFAEGGSGANGTVFKVTPEGTLTTLFSFNQSTGGTPEAALVLGSDGNFYGTTARGGTVFRMTPGGAHTTLVNFTGINGMQPTAALVLGNDGNFYGTTTRGGAFSDINGNGYGTVFKMTPGGNLTTLVNFAEVNGSFPSGPLVRDGDGNFYGTTTKGGSYSDFNGNTYGTIFKMTTGGELTTLVNFSGANGLFPITAALVEGGDGHYYGTTYFGGSSGTGTVFKMTSTGSLTTLVNFTVSSRSYPNTLLLGGDGDLYGTTRNGGIYSSSSGSPYGTVFKVTSAGTLTNLANFNSANGSYPGAGLVQGSDGSFYGTTQHGGNFELGTVFRMTPEGSLNTLVHFTGTNGRLPSAELVQGNDGNFYGATSDGGSGGLGTVFMMTPAGTLTTLVNFTGGNGSYPSALVQGSDGNFYGRSGGGGSGGTGTVFMMTPAGTLTTLVNFTGGNGSFPIAGLVLGSDGNFYGMTRSGGSNRGGTAFKMTPAGILTTLVNFEEGDRLTPAASLLQGSDGNFYGTTKDGGTFGFGTVFMMTPGGALTTLESFTGGNGAYPEAALVRGSDGNLYGTTREGGGGASDNRTAGGGQIYRLRMGPSVLSQSQTNVTTSTATLNGTVNPGGYETPVSFHYGPDPTLATFSMAAAGTLPVGSTDRSVQAAISGLQRGSLYFFRAVASNAENTVPRFGPILSFIANDSQGTFPGWAATQFSSAQLADPLISGPGADSDQDGVVNLLECAFNLNPLISGNPILIAGTGTSGLPIIRRNQSPPAFSIQYLRRKTSTNPGLTYIPQFSSSLDEAWSTFAGTETVQSIDATWERVTAEDAPSTQEKRFGRVKVVYEE